MQNNYHKYIQNNFDTYDVGEYQYTSKLFGREKTSRAKLPIHMHKGGLLLMGCDKSLRRRFSAHYAKTLLNEGKSVIYITDALTKERYRSEEDSNEFYQHIGFKELKDGKIHIGDITDHYNSDFLNNDGHLYVIKTNTGEKLMNKDSQQEYDDQLLSFLENIANIHRQNGQDSDLHNKHGVVVFIDEDCYPPRLDEGRLRGVRNTFSRYGIGLVVGSFEARRYDTIADSFEHLIFFKIKDPTETVWKFSTMRVQSIDWKPNRYNFRLGERDLRNLKYNEFYYCHSRLAGFSNLSTFDAGGCKCCIQSVMSD